MTNSANIPRGLIIFGIAIPLAALLGFLVATPEDLLSMAGVAAIAGILAMPFILKWHHLLLVFSLNAALIVSFLPGSPNVWMMMAFVSLGITLLNRILDKDIRLLNVSSVTWSLILFALVVWITAKMTGGAGLRALGGGVYGGKKYFFIWFAVAAYFALSFQRTPPSKAETYVSGYLLSGLSSILSNLVYMAGPAAWVLYAFIPVDSAMHQIYEDFAGGPGGERFSRLGGIAVAGTTAVPFLVMRYGIHGLLDYTKPWRFLILMTAIGLSALGGFRSTIALYGLIFAVQFVSEGLLRTRLFPVLAFAGALGFAVLIPTAQHLPLSVQRSLSVLQIPVSAAAQFDADGSTRWRKEMWELVSLDIPRYFWVGKGFTANATDYYLTQEMVKRHMVKDYEATILAGDYHNGPLSILIPFGIWGVLAFLWFVIASLQVLYRNYRHGAPQLQRINTFLFSYFLAKVLFFLTVFGAIHLDLLAFVGIVGLSVSLNGGVSRKKTAIEKRKSESALTPSLATGQPAFGRGLD